MCWRRTSRVSVVRVGVGVLLEYDAGGMTARAALLHERLTEISRIRPSRYVKAAELTAASQQLTAS